LSYHKEWTDEWGQVTWCDGSLGVYRANLLGDTGLRDAALG